MAGLRGGRWGGVVYEFVCAVWGACRRPRARSPCGAAVVWPWARGVVGW